MEIIGWLANLLFFSGGCFKSPRKTIATYMTADMMYVALYLSMDIYLGAIAMLATTLRSGLSLVLSDKHNLYSVILLTFASCVFVLINSNSVYDLTIFFATILIGLSAYYRDHFYKFRITTSLSQILWIVHSLIFGVYPMIFCCLIMLSTNIGAMLYYSGIKTTLFRYVGLTRKSVGT